jgi:hypothetical protein
MNKSIIIIGKGYSVTKCTKEFVDSHDEVAIINSPVYGEYEHLISNHADYLFTNKTGMLYNHDQIKKLGLKEMIFTGRGNQKFQRPSNHVKMVYPNPNIFDHFDNNIGFWPNSGLQAVYYLVNSGKYNKISLVGFDFYQLGLPPYYFDPKYVHSELKYLWQGDWKDNKVNVPNLHDEEKTINFLVDFIKNNNNIKFNIITLKDTFKNISLDNLTFINDESK